MIGSGETGPVRSRFHSVEMRAKQGEESGSGLTGVQKMEDWDLKEDRAEPPGSSCLSMRSDRSKGNPPFLSIEPGPSDLE
ncbi:hypothetical protein AMECASPLE_025802 [Ameca splendens]|uniref:Uncharacterized protein n=1 Tax=Ameca splendens TaxID=208324 RepID=A0ABV0YS46_9TELE